MSIKAISSNNETLVSPKKIVNHITNEWFKYSPGEHFSQVSMSSKYAFTAFFNKLIKFCPSWAITLLELNGCLKKAKWTLSGLVRIT